MNYAGKWQAPMTSVHTFSPEPDKAPASAAAPKLTGTDDKGTPFPTSKRRYKGVPPR
jgi:hypothetical protein